MIENSLTYRVLAWGLKPLSRRFPRAGINAGPWPRFLLTAFLFTVFFVPRLSLKVSGLPYAVDVRAEDFIFFILLARAFLQPRNLQTTAGVMQEPAGLYFLFFLIAAQISIFSGLAAGTIDKPWLSALYLLKWTQYAGIYFITWRLVRCEEDGRFFLRVFFFLGLALAAYGYAEFFLRAKQSLSYYRLYERAPFGGDANHVGCFFVIWMSFFTAYYLRETISWRRAAILPALLFVLIPFLGCQSRKSMLALGAALGVGFVLSKSRRRLIPVMVLLAAAGLFLTPGHLLMRLRPADIPAASAAAIQAQGNPDTLYSLNTGFNSDEEFYTGDDADQTGLYLKTWRWMLRGTEKIILWGCGLGARHRSLYESQYVLLLSETGFTGLILFILLCVSPLRTLWRNARQSINSEAAALGWTMALAGVLVHNITCVSLSVVKVAVPFWFLTALVLKLSAVREKEPETFCFTAGRENLLN